MRFFRQVLRYTVAIVAVTLVVAASAAAQGVTGTITGAVKDAQGGVIPGATVTLISGTRGTASSPVVTNASGDFVFPNVAADWCVSFSLLPKILRHRSPSKVRARSTDARDVLFIAPDQKLDAPEKNLDALNETRGAPT